MTNNSSKTLICVVGPTAVGKTKLAITLAKLYQTEIISADSRQLYREMTIGTAKPSVEELTAVPHHFINSHSINEAYSAGHYEKNALSCINNLFQHTDIVLLVGGSGLYVNAVCTGLDDLPKPAEGVREGLIKHFTAHGLSYLQEQLKQVDPSYYQEVDVNNPQRIIRALEVFETTKIPFSHWRKKNLSLRNFNTITIGLNIDRESLYGRINNRVDQMMEEGLLAEVEALIHYRHKTPLLSVGYSELFDYYDGKYTLQEAIDKIKQNSRRYAKRQLTWFKRNKDTVWFSPDEVSSIVDHIQSRLFPDN